MAKQNKIEPLVSIVISTFNRKKKLIRLIKSIYESTYKQLEIIIVDDSSKDGTYETITEMFSNIKIIRNNKELLPSASRNIGIKISKGDLIFIVDDDNILERDTIYELVRIYIENKKAGIIGPIGYYLNSKKIMYAGNRINSITFTSYNSYGDKDNNIIKNDIIYCDYIPNAYMISKELIVKIGGFDDQNFQVGWEEVDLAKRVKILGYDIFNVSNAVIYHDGIISRNDHLTNTRVYYRGRTRVRFYLKYAKWRLLFIPIDIVGFMALIFLHRINNKKELLGHYLKGLLEGIINDEIDDYF